MKSEEEIEHFTDKLGETLLDTLLLSDARRYSEKNLRTIEKSNNLIVIEESCEITEKEIKDALFKMAKKEALDFDDITAEISYKSWSKIKRHSENNEYSIKSRKFFQALENRLGDSVVYIGLGKDSQ